MAREIAVIKQQIIDEKNAQTSLVDLNSPSQTAIWNLWAFITAVSINIFEQLLDVFKIDIEARISRAGAGTLPWLRDRILEFQSGGDVEYTDGVIAYPVVDTTLNIITRCSVTDDGNRVVKAKVAKSEPPAPLSAPEVTELQFYLAQIRFAGTQINIVNQAADFLAVSAQVEYDGQYASTIQTDVVAALDAYCVNLSTVDNFNGLIEVNAIESAILSAPGAKRVKLTEVAVRAFNQSFATRNIVYSLSGGVDLLKFETVAGYAVQETESGETFTDSITFVAV